MLITFNEPLNLHERGRSERYNIAIWYCRCAHFVVSPEALSELHDESLSNELASLRELDVDDGHQAGVDMREHGGGGLGLNDGARQQPSEGEGGRGGECCEVSSLLPTHLPLTTFSWKSSCTILPMFETFTYKRNKITMRSLQAPSHPLLSGHTASSPTPPPPVPY